MLESIGDLFRLFFFIPLSHTWVRIQSFLALSDELLLSVVLFWLMGLSFLIFTRSKEQVKITFLIAPYLGIISHLIASLILTLILPIVQASVFSVYVLIGAALVSIFLKKRFLSSLFSFQLINRFFVGLICSMIIIFFIHNFTYQNGLHDEWFHYPVIQHTIEGNAKQFVHPTSGVVSNSYHTGSYFAVMAVQQLIQPDLEQALDITKMVFWLPFVPIISWLIAKSWKLPVWKISVIVFSSLFLGPGLFFFDRFTQNVFTGSSFPQPVNPLFFEISTITWVGAALSLSVLLLIIHWLEKKEYLSILMSVVQQIGLIFIHKLFFFVTLLTCLFLLVSEPRAQAWILKRKMKAFLLLITSGVVLILSPQFSGLFNHLFITSGKFHFPIKQVSEWGFPYQESGAVSFASFAALDDLRLSGVNNLIGIFLLIWSIRRKLLPSRWLIIFGWNVFCLPLIVFFFRFGGGSDTLALDKLIRFSSFFISLLYGFLVLHPKVTRRVKVVIIVLMFCSVFSSLYYFSTANVLGVNREWVSQ